MVAGNTILAHATTTERNAPHLLQRTSAFLTFLTYWYLAFKILLLAETGTPTHGHLDCATILTTLSAAEANGTAQTEE